MRPPSTEDLIAWARKEADRVAGGLGKLADVSPGIEFLRRYAGTDSVFYTVTDDILSNARYAYEYASTAARARDELAGTLRSWADFAESGLATAVPFELAARAEAATDLIDQASQLLGDRDHSAASAVMLAGAALEEFLRGLWETTTQQLSGKTGITAYANALRSAGTLQANDVKELTALAGVRNAAAHGDFDEIDDDRARIFVDRVAFFLQRHRPT